MCLIPGTATSSKRLDLDDSLPCLGILQWNDCRSSALLLFVDIDESTTPSAGLDLDEGRSW